MDRFESPSKKDRFTSLLTRIVFSLAIVAMTWVFAGCPTPAGGGDVAGGDEDTIMPTTGAGTITISDPVTPEVSLSGYVSPLTYGTSMTVTASLTPSSDLPFTWYLDGNLVPSSTTSTWTSETTLFKGAHSLMAEVSVDGRLCCATNYFTVQ